MGIIGFLSLRGSTYPQGYLFYTFLATNFRISDPLHTHRSVWRLNRSEDLLVKLCSPLRIIQRQIKFNKPSKSACRNHTYCPNTDMIRWISLNLQNTPCFCSAMDLKWSFHFRQRVDSECNHSLARVRLEAGREPPRSDALRPQRERRVPPKEPHLKHCERALRCWLVLHGTVCHVLEWGADFSEIWDFQSEHLQSI